MESAWAVWPEFELWLGGIASITGILNCSLYALRQGHEHAGFREDAFFKNLLTRCQKILKHRIFSKLGSDSSYVPSEARSPGSFLDKFLKVIKDLIQEGSRVNAEVKKIVDGRKKGRNKKNKRN